MNNIKTKGFLQNYSSILWLLGGISVGSIFGLIFGEGVAIIKPIGDIFLNLLFTAIIPLVFFTISSSVANLEKTNTLGKLFITVLVVFLGTVVVSAVVMMIGVVLFPIHQDIIVSKLPLETMHTASGTSQITQLLTVTDFF